ncbi:enoyl-CoA hydratase [Aestuariirhabdus litorea]|uniref:Enoyl-CoA hydratase n=1 Tax=Aestuariirhabdus litorea TaxID=2528527 RepID=A0A3P3VJA0_9GAMM|nr:enoyl-CoA hydratase [Aestuariirhabdus litorea]RRJ82805.1 enoyl-CoA hydratase [Aestuariirhabdus litorea]RWW92964.1 enoyl-CoA hydratase [Endozoicomonadaceae bacterium GTF-13]
MASELTLNIENRIATISLNRPEKLNALTTDGFLEFSSSLEALSYDPDVSVVVVTGQGRAFCAGGDVAAMATGEEFTEATLEGRAQTLRRAMECARLLHEMPKPTIAMLRGATAGAGLSIALSADLRIASTNCRLLTAFKDVAYSGDFGGSYFMTQLLGPAKARELYFLSPRLDANEALQLGLVNRVVEDEALELATQALAAELSSGPTMAFRYMKRNLNAAETCTLAEVMELEAWNHTRTGMTEDHLEGARAFVEKRTPTFKGI